MCDRISRISTGGGVVVKIQQSAENYLETIYMLSRVRASVRSIDIANELEFSKPSVSIAMKNLRENGYISVSDDGSITLTEAGESIARAMYERHTMITRWLVSLGVDERVASDDACKIEHVISAETFEAIKRHAVTTSYDNQTK